MINRFLVNTFLLIHQEGQLLIISGDRVHARRIQSIPADAWSSSKISGPIVRGEPPSVMDIKLQASRIGCRAVSWDSIAAAVEGEYRGLDQDPLPPIGISPFDR